MAVAQPGHLALRVAELERVVSGMFRYGTVEEVDPKNHTVRLNLGKDDDGETFKSAVIPYGQTAGAFKFHNPPSKGQQMLMLSPNGDWEQAKAMPFHWSDKNKSPSEKGDEHIMTFGDAKVEVRGNEIIISVGGSSIKVTGADITVTSDKIETVGATHLDKGTRKVHYVGGKDSAGDLAVDGANRVYV